MLLNLVRKISAGKAMRCSFRRIAIGALTWLGLCLYFQGASFAQTASALENDQNRDKLCTVAGQVVRADTNAPLRKARIVVTNKDDRSADPYVAITDADGQFKIGGILPARYDLNVQHDGYIPKSYGEDESGGTSTVLLLTAGQTVTNMMFRLQRYGVITGRVLDEDGDPARGVAVEMVWRYKIRGKVALGAGGRAETNDLGEYRLFDLPPGSYFLRAYPPSGNGRIIGKVLLENSILKSAGGCVPTFYPSVVEASRASAIEVKAGDEIPRVDIVLKRIRSHRIRGNIYNAAVDNPAGRTRIGLLPKDADLDQNIPRAEVDQKTGAFEIDDVPDGSYQVWATYRDALGEFVGSVPILVAGADVDSVRVVITRGAEIHGRLISEGKSVPQTVSIELIDKEQVGNYTGETAPDGTFTVRGLPDGLYEFRPFSDCDVCYLKSATANGADVLKAGLQVSSGAAPSPVELVYSSDTSTVDGTVVSDDGSGAQGATVVLVWDENRLGPDWERYRSEPTDQYGHFIFAGVPPGSYHAFAWLKVDRESYMDPEFLKRYEQKSQALSISESEKKTIQLTLLPSLGESH